MFGQSISRCNNCSLLYKIDYLCCNECFSACHGSHKLMPVNYNGDCACCKLNPKCKKNNWMMQEKKLYESVPPKYTTFDRFSTFDVNTRLKQSSTDSTLFDFNTRDKNDFMNNTGNDMLFSRMLNTMGFNYSSNNELASGLRGTSGIFKSYLDMDTKSGDYDQFNFAWNLLQNYYRVLPNKKFVLSPWGLYISLCSLYLGSSGRLEHDLNNLLNCNVEKKLDYIIKTNSDIMSFYGYLGSTLFIINKNIPIKIPYYKKIEPLTDIQLIRMDCLEPELNRLNKFIEGKSSKAISSFFAPGSIPLNTNSILLSYYYFYCTLKIGFPLVRKEQFLSSNSKTKTVVMMHLTNSSQYYSESPDFQLLEMEYSNPNFRIGFFMSKNNTFNEIIDYIKGLRKIIIDHIAVPKINQQSKFFVDELYKYTGDLTLSTNETNMISPYEGTLVTRITHYISFSFDDKGGPNDNYIKSKTGINFVGNQHLFYYVRHVPSNSLIINGCVD